MSAAFLLTGLRDRTSATETHPSLAFQGLFAVQSLKGFSVPPISALSSSGKGLLYPGLWNYTWYCLVRSQNAAEEPLPD
jgi:hypothetical protein